MNSYPISSYVLAIRKVNDTEYTNLVMQSFLIECNYYFLLQKVDMIPVRVIVVAHYRLVPNQDFNHLCVLTFCTHNLYIY